MNKVFFHKKIILIIFILIIFLISKNSIALSSVGEELGIKKEELNFVVTKNTLREMKIGATIRTTDGPVEIDDVLSRILRLLNYHLNGPEIKGIMWEKGTDYREKVLVDISMNDNYDLIFNNLLGRIHYKYEIIDNIIIVKQLDN